MSAARERVIAAYGVVARPRGPLADGVVEAALGDLAHTMFPNASVAVAEAIDRGSLVSGRPERFTFVDVRRPDRSFAFCRFRHFQGGLEFLFNLSDGPRSSGEVERYLAGRLDLELVRSELL